MGLYRVPSWAQGELIQSCGTYPEEEEEEEEQEQEQGKKSAGWYRAHARLILPSVTA